MGRLQQCLGCESTKVIGRERARPGNQLTVNVAGVEGNLVNDCDTQCFQLFAHLPWQVAGQVTYHWG